MPTEILRPSGAGDETNIDYQYPEIGNHWDKVDEAIADEDSTILWIAQNSYELDLFNLENSSGSGVINSLIVYARVRGEGDEEIEEYMQPCFKIAIKTNGTVYEDTARTPVSSFLVYSKEWANNPNTGNAWTWDEVNSLQAGIFLRKSFFETICTQIYVGIDYDLIGDRFYPKAFTSSYRKIKSFTSGG